MAKHQVSWQVALIRRKWRNTSVMASCSHQAEVAKHQVSWQVALIRRKWRNTSVMASCSHQAEVAKHQCHGKALVQVFHNYKSCSLLLSSFIQYTCTICNHLYIYVCVYIYIYIYKIFYVIH